jgi:hypothetical protein
MSRKDDCTLRFDLDQLQSLLRDSWSSRTSAHPSERNPARGQCGVTTLVINDHFGGEILKTSVGEIWHFYNRIEGRRVDFTAEQFRRPVEYLDIVSSREEALAHVTDEQYRELARNFAEAVEKAKR